MFVCAQIVSAQVKIRYNANKEKLEKLEYIKKSLPNSLPTKILPSFDYSQLIAEDKTRESSGLPARYGKRFDVQWSTSNSGTWSELKDNKIWHLKIHSPGAYSLAFQFDQFHLPQEATLLIYNEEESFMYGPLTIKNNKEHGGFTTGPIQGDCIILELVVSNKKKEKLKLNINGIIHGYKNLFLENTGYETSGNYNINIECRSNWEDESDAVARLINDIYYGSGALVNNTANDYTPYFLTAFHNIDVNESGTLTAVEIQALANCQFQFHYKSPNCSPTSNSGYIEFVGADLISHWGSTDFILLELDDSPVGNGDITYLGWDNRNNIPNSVVCIHHPSGDVMKYSYDNESPTLEWSNTHWFVDNWYEGTTEPGSSGSPLFNQNSKVIGQDHAGDGEDPCDVDKGTYFGCFHESWDGDGTNDNQLAHWLDPNDTGDPTTDLIRSPSITVPDVICYSGHTVSIQNPPGTTITWGGTNVSYPYGNTGTSVTVRATSSTTSVNGTVTASFSVNGISRTITHPVWVGKPQIYAYGSHIVDVNTGMPVYDFCYGISNDVEAVHPAGDAGITDWDWQVSYGQVYPYGMLDQYATIYPNDYQSFMLEIRDCNTCGYSDWAHMYTNVVNCGRFLLIFTPNPTTGETTLSIESESEEKAFDDTAEWEMEIYSESQLLKEKKTSLRGKSTKIQTQGWKDGVYLVRVKYKDEILTGKLVVKK